MWRRLAISGLLLVCSLGPAEQPPAIAAGLSGTLLVSRPNGVVLVRPLSGDTSLLPVGSIGAAPQGVAWSEDRQQMAISVRMRQAGERVGGADIVLLDSGGAEVSSIQRDQPDVALVSPVWLPGGEIAYERDDLSGSSNPSRIEAAQPDGSARRVLVSNAHLPGPAPDGARLAFVAPGQPFDRLMIVDLSTGDSVPLVENSNQGFVYFSRPRFSPDGRWVAFGAAGGPTLPDTTGMLPLGGGILRGGLLAGRRLHGPGWDVWVIGADGASLRQVTRFEYEDDLAVAWSPDGQWLAAFGPNALYLQPVGVSGPATPISRGGLGEPDWASAELF